MADRHPTSIPSAVRIGGKTKTELLQALREHAVALNEAAEALFADARFTTLTESHDIEVAAVSVSDLGFADGTTYEQLVARALGLGLVECPLETAPHLRLQFLNQPEAAVVTPTGHRGAPPNAITVASPPLDSLDETPKGFYLTRAAGILWLRGYWSWPGHIWVAQDVLLFARQDAAT